MQQRESWHDYSNGKSVHAPTPLLHKLPNSFLCSLLAWLLGFECVPPLKFMLTSRSGTSKRSLGQCKPLSCLPILPSHPYFLAPSLCPFVKGWHSKKAVRSLLDAGALILAFWVSRIVSQYISLIINCSVCIILLKLHKMEDRVTDHQRFKINYNL